ncbi:MAG: hypothetical protein AB7T27_04120 [Kiritimatiellia bacterium]
MKLSWIFCVLAVLLSAGCATRAPRISEPQPLVTYDDQGRVLRHVTFNPDHSINTVKAYQYVDSGVSIETVTTYDGTNGWTATETYNMLESAVGLKKVQQYDADGNLLSDRNVLVNPGSRAVKVHNRP